MATVLNPIEIVAGVEADTDETNQATPHYVASDKIRFVDGIPEKIGGWDILDPIGNEPIVGTPRNIYSFTLGNIIRYLLATNTSLYSLIGQQLTNITPVITSGTVLTDPFSTYYGTLANNPISTVIGTSEITVLDTAHRNIVGDLVKLSGATTTNGILNTLINANQVVTSVSTNSWTFSVSANATSTGSGGGASVVRATEIVKVDQTAHGYFEGENVILSGATHTGNNIGGIPIADFNTFFQIRNVATNSYDIQMPTFATSAAGPTGGTVTVKPQIAVGLASATTGAGYGMGPYGIGLYGTALMASSPTPPRIWSFDRFGSYVVMTPGDQLGLYSWNGSISTLPALVTNAPTAINYTFVSDNICTVLGAAGVGNNIQWSDQGNLTIWVDDTDNQAGNITQQDADTFISHAPIQGANVLFTKTKSYIYKYIGAPFTYSVTFLDNKGLIARNARISINGVVIWMGPKNFYMYKGGNVTVIPSNTKAETTLKKYIFNNLSSSQQDKIFCWFNEKFNEVWFHYPSTMANEPDTVARVNLNDFTWSPDTMQRSAAEYPYPLQLFPYAADMSGNIYRHENGYDNAGEAMTWSLSTRYILGGKDNTDVMALIPDNIQTAGDITVIVNLKQYPNGPASNPPNTPFTIATDTIRLEYRSQSRYRQYVLGGSALGQFWRGGSYQEEIQKGTPR